MNIFEKASRIKLRFATRSGSLSVEDMWDLSLTSLNTIAKTLNRNLKVQEEEDFLDPKPLSEDNTKISFDIVLHILKTKQEEIKRASDAEARKETKQKILAILEKKKDGALEEKTEEELIEELKKLDD